MREDRFACAHSTGTGRFALRTSSPGVILNEVKNLSCCMTRVVKEYYVYIMSSHSKRLYVGMTNDLYRRVWEHKSGLIEGFTKRYNLKMLVYYETADDVRAVIAREKQIKGWLRSRKIDLIESFNPEWDDLAMTWFKERS